MFQGRKIALIGLASLLALSQIAPANAVSVKKGLTACPIVSSYTITGKSTGWMPTNQFTGMTQGPLSVPFMGTRTYLTPSIYSGSVTVAMTNVVAAANATYGTGTYVNVSSVTANWDWSGTIASGQSQLMVLHRGDKITFTEIQDNANCTTTTTTGLVAYLPLSANPKTNYCNIVDISPAKTNWSSTCMD